jgi:CDP-glucose 4,6-dehydratase
MGRDFWRGRRVLITGHTGFKGGWLSLWLQSMGAEVHGYALAAPTDPNLFSAAGVGAGMASSTMGDIRDAAALATTFGAVHPEVVFHLAAQALVRASYQQPVETFAVNVMGTVNVLEAVRTQPEVRAVVNVTSDKCYENREWGWGYRETDPMGGHDPYSASKGCAEIATAAYRRSFMQARGVALASARAGNVIGGGDWAADRLIPDFLRAIDAGRTLTIRSPNATRPWQHVLDPLSGYLMLAERLTTEGQAFAEAWNFGPADEDAQPVHWILDTLAELHPGVRWACDAAPQPHEAEFLRLDSSKARLRLGWKPRWVLRDVLARTLAWHRAWREGRDMRAATLAQIAEYDQQAVA